MEIYYSTIVYQAKHAEISGCSGLIMYTDPKDYAVEGVGAVYPGSVYLPGTGVQRGSLESDTGDPLTPGHPSLGSLTCINIKINIQ